VASDPFLTAGGSGDAGTATGASVIRLTDPALGGRVQNGVNLLFYGTGSDGNTFSARIITWSPIISTGLSSVNPTTTLWVPTVLAEVALTLSSSCPGLTGRTIGAGELFADTITLTGTTANAGIDVDIRSPANNTIAQMFADLSGGMELELSFTTGGSVTDCNALYRIF
jgi:hypothetical protein